MDNKEDSSLALSSDPAAVLRGRQATILAEIDALTRAASNDMSLNRRIIASLKQQYNEIVEKRAEWERDPLADPLQALPPELWPNIFEEVLRGPFYPLEVLLDFTLVSQTWSAALISLAELWTKIWLDCSKEDYLAKALLGLYLSKEREIELYFGYMTLDEWQKISPRIALESRRIRCLSFAGIRTVPPQDLEPHVLKDLSDLPILRDLLLSNAHGIPRDPQEYLREVKIERMPSLQSIGGLVPSGQPTPWHRFITDHWIKVERVQKEDINSLECLPGLKSLGISESSEHHDESDNSRDQIFSLKLVEVFNYHGPDPLRSLKWIGSNLTRLSITYPPNVHPGVVLAAISRFPRLQTLAFVNIGDFGVWTNPVAITSADFELSVKHLILLGHGAGESDMASYDYLVRELATVSPRVETLYLNQMTLTDAMLTSIVSLKSLHSLDIACCHLHSSTSSLSLVVNSLQWYGDDHSVEKFFSALHFQALHTLLLVVYERSFQEALKKGEKDRDVRFKRSNIPRDAFPYVTSLCIRLDIPTIWVLRSFPMLRELEMGYESSASIANDWRSDVLEAILLRPRDNPALEQIALRGKFADWDILILMLERKNLLAESGITRIKTLEVDTELSYKLLYPISELLGGRFVERDSNSSFSIESIGQRLWNKSGGCIQCCSLFRECKLQPTFLDGTHAVSPDAAPSNLDHPLPIEDLTADPPLPLEVAHWLSGRRERWKAFMGGYNEAANTFYRRSSCHLPGGNIIVNRYSLAGAKFGPSDEAGY